MSTAKTRMRFQGHAYVAGHSNSQHHHQNSSHASGSPSTSISSSLPSSPPLSLSSALSASAFKSLSQQILEIEEYAHLEELFRSRQSLVYRAIRISDALPVVIKLPNIFGLISVTSRNLFHGSSTSSSGSQASSNSTAGQAQQTVQVGASAHKNASTSSTVIESASSASSVSMTSKSSSTSLAPAADRSGNTVFQGQSGNVEVFPLPQHRMVSFALQFDLLKLLERHKIRGLLRAYVLAPLKLKFVLDAQGMPTNKRRADSIQHYSAGSDAPTPPQSNTTLSSPALPPSTLASSTSSSSSGLSPSPAPAPPSSLSSSSSTLTGGLQIHRVACWGLVLEYFDGLSLQNHIRTRSANLQRNKERSKAEKGKDRVQITSSDSKEADDDDDTNSRTSQQSSSVQVSKISRSLSSTNPSSRASSTSSSASLNAFVPAPFDIGESLRIGIGICDILASIHELNIVHRDISAANILYSPSLGEVRLIDFGLASVTVVEDRLSTRAFHATTTAVKKVQQLQGTIEYLSPEQTGRLSKLIDYRSDLYSLGVVLFQLLTGYLPFGIARRVEKREKTQENSKAAKKKVNRVPSTEKKLRAISGMEADFTGYDEFGESGGAAQNWSSVPPHLSFNQDPLTLIHSILAKVPQSPHLIRPDIPPVLSMIILKLLAKNPDQRYQSAWGLASDLKRVYDEWCKQTRANESTQQTRDDRDAQSKRVLLREKTTESDEGSVDAPLRVTIAEFVLGEQDISRRLIYPDRLFGRDHEQHAIVQAFIETLNLGEKHLLLVHGNAGIGRCWSPNTPIMKHDGKILPVAEVNEGDLLMGDDGTARLVHAGSFIRDYGPMFEIRPQSRHRRSWQCNADHILVLQLDTKPFITPVQNKFIIQYVTMTNATKPNCLPSLCNVTCGQQPNLVRMFETKLAAMEEISHCESLGRICAAGVSSAVFECTVIQFLSLSNTIQKKCSLYQPALIQFPPPKFSVKMRIQQQFPHARISQQCVVHAARLIGATLTYAGMRTHTSRQNCTCTRMAPDTLNRVAELLAQRIMLWRKCIVCLDHSFTASAESAHQVLAEFLSDLKLSPDNEWPLELLTDCPQIRRGVLAGVLDCAEKPCGHTIRTSCKYTLAACSHLCTSLGAELHTSTKMCAASCSSVAATIPLDCVCEWSLGNSKRDGANRFRTFGFSIVPVGVAEFCGFTVSGNGRLVLGDGTVTHNTALLKSAYLAMTNLLVERQPGARGSQQSDNDRQAIKAARNTVHRSESIFDNPLILQAKFEPNKVTPHYVLRSVIRDVIDQIQSERSDMVHRWKKRIRQAVDTDVYLVLQVFPALKPFLSSSHAHGETLSTRECDARIRFRFCRLMRCFATKRHPIILLFDDLHYADSAAIDLISALLADADIKYVCLIASYREELITRDYVHSLIRQAQSSSDVRFSDLSLKPFTLLHVNQLLSEMLGTSLTRTLDFAAQLLSKSEGNPFILSQLLKTMSMEGKFTFVRAESMDQAGSNTTANRGGYWRWDEKALVDVDAADSAKQFIHRQLFLLPKPSISALQYAAVLGIHFESHSLALAMNKTRKELSLLLEAPLRESLIYVVEGTLMMPTVLNTITNKTAHAVDKKAASDTNDSAANAGSGVSSESKELKSDDGEEHELFADDLLYPNIHYAFVHDQLFSACIDSIDTRTKLGIHLEIARTTITKQTQMTDALLPHKFLPKLAQFSTTVTLVDVDVDDKVFDCLSHYNDALPLLEENDKGHLMAPTLGSEWENVDEKMLVINLNIVAAIRTKSLHTKSAQRTAQP